MDLSSMFTDDQIAVVGCFLALAVCGGIAGLSFRFGPAGGSAEADSHKGVQFRKPEAETTESKRKAA
jgi:hypothetical protein